MGDRVDVCTARSTVRGIVTDVRDDRVRIDVVTGPVTVRLTYSPDGRRLIGARLTNDVAESVIGTLVEAVYAGPSERGAA